MALPKNNNFFYDRGIHPKGYELISGGSIEETEPITEQNGMIGTPVIANYVMATFVNRALEEILIVFIKPFGPGPNSIIVEYYGAKKIDNLAPLKKELEQLWNAKDRLRIEKKSRTLHWYKFNKILGLKEYRNKCLFGKYKKIYW